MTFKLQLDIEEFDKLLLSPNKLGRERDSNIINKSFLVEKLRNENIDIEIKYAPCLTKKGVLNTLEFIFILPKTKEEIKSIYQSIKNIINSDHWRYSFINEYLCPIVMEFLIKYPLTLDNFGQKLCTLHNENEPNVSFICSNESLEYFDKNQIPHGVVSHIKLDILKRRRNKDVKLSNNRYYTKN